MVYYSKYYALLWFTIVNTMLYYGLLQCILYFTTVYYIVNTMLNYGVLQWIPHFTMVYYSEYHALPWFTTASEYHISS